MNPRRRRHQRGLSLPVVLVALVLVAGMGVGLLQFVSVQRKISHSAALRQECRQYRSAIEVLLKRQLTAATIEEGTVWTSQPGLLRTFDESGNPATAYKLYSAREMEVDVPGGVDYQGLEANDAPADWDEYPAEYVDLNASRDGLYPIVDPAAAGLVAGFDFDSSRGVVMPVQWLYLLRDGRIVAPERLGGGERVRLAGASRDNPAVARLAFWTDDETCRVNVNTACGGAPWSVPLTTSAEDIDLAWNQPVKREYVRYPGHPARVDLGAAFPELLIATGPRAHQIFLQASSAYSPGGSDHGTVNTIATRANNLEDKRRPPFHSVDDWAQEVREQGGSALDGELLDQRRFFVTTRSPSSDLNLMGRPRVTLWPVHADSSQVCTTERVFALLSTLPLESQVAYHFERSSNLDGAGDGQLPSNQAMLDFLREMTAMNPPGFAGGSLQGKFGVADRDAVLAGVLDHVRLLRTKPDIGNNDFTPTGIGQGQVAPIELGDGSSAVRGVGRVPTVTEVALHFYGSENDPAGQTTKMSAVLLLELAYPGQGYPNLEPQLNIRVRSLRPAKVDGTPLAFSGSIDLPRIVNDPEGRPLERLDSGLLSCMAFIRSSPPPSPPGGPPSLGSGPPSGGPGGGSPPAGGPPSDSAYPFLVEDLAVTGGAFSLGGGDYEIEIRVPDGSGGLRTHQVLSVRFPTASNWPVPNFPGFSTTRSFAQRYSGDLRREDFFNNDTVRSVEHQGDLRILVRQAEVEAGEFGPGNQGDYDSGKAHASSLQRGPGFFFQGADTGRLVTDAAYSGDRRVNLPASVNGVRMANGRPGDWESGRGNLPDGAWSRKSDEGFGGQTAPPGRPPYFIPSQAPATITHWFPRRELASPVHLGALPRGRNTHWETLLFCANPAAGPAHPGFSDPPDHLWLDLFRLPVIEPFPLGDAVSARGRVNLNTQIAPFASIERTTALAAALRSVRLTAIPLDSAARYKESNNSESYRVEVDVPETIGLLQQRFADGDVFRNETEICTQFLVPEGASSAPAFWSAHELTGDNAREEPYAQLLPLLTTRSHAYRVYYQIERIKQPRFLPEDEWSESEGRVLARVEGAMRLVRKLDAQHEGLRGQSTANIDLEPYFRIEIEELGDLD
ncbi:MAG: hypothetical protein AAGK14_06220 [Verrucomicrobiota bacterium]